MRCSKATEYLSRGMDEQLPPDVTVDLTRHLDGCESCLAFREDLLMGRRVLAATEPEISENFEWKLQLKLNQALQEAVGATSYPWEEEAEDRWSWFRSFGAAAAVGLAAVLALAMFVGPDGGPQSPSVGPAMDLRTANPGIVATAAGGSLGSDRLPFRIDNRRGGLYSSGMQRSVSSGDGQGFSSGGRFVMDRGWSGGYTDDLLTIQRLKEQNQQLNHRLYLFQRELLRLRSELDRGDSNTLDLEQKP